ncbi:TPA: RHS repeat-associated core domain-containing protein [Klebsiella aerogenes]
MALLTQEAGRKESWHYHCDPNGAPVRLTSLQGEIVWSEKTGVWGEKGEVYADRISNPLRFQGQYFDAETGLHYNRHRYYVTEIAGFISQDPIGLAGGLNVYQYAPDPLGWVDPWGLTGKPLNSPDISKWLNKGGTVWQEVESKVWVYQDSAGNVVRYPEEFPDFTPYERQSVNVPDLRGDHSKSPGGDFGKADAIAPKGQANYDLNTWYHHKNGIAMQEVPKNIHRRFTHRGGVSKIKSNCQ